MLHTWLGIQISGPTLFETSCEGSSAIKKQTYERGYNHQQGILRYRSKAYFEQHVSGVKIVSGHAKVFKEVIRVGLRYVRAVQVQSEEHDPCPNHDVQVDLAHKRL